MFNIGNSPVGFVLIDRGYHINHLAMQALVISVRFVPVHNFNPLVHQTIAL